MSHDFARIWERIELHHDEDYRLGNRTEEYERVVRAFGDTRFSAEQIGRLSIMLKPLQIGEDFTDKAGFFLSAAINLSPDTDFVIHTSHFEEAPNFLGFMNKKRIRIVGDAGAWSGSHMDDGIITITGNAHLPADSLQGGRMVIEGDAISALGEEMAGGNVLVKGCFRGALWPDGEELGRKLSGGVIKILGDVCVESIGSEMTGGRIIITGDLDSDRGVSEIGNCMTGGEIHLEGEIGQHYEIKGGRIYHRGRLLVDL
jgi:formylmethanofuran dehydrogenase subunit C